MKHESNKTAGTGKTVQLFSLGKEEMRLIHDLCKKFAEDNKGIFETLIARNRAKTIVKILEKFL